MNAAAAARNSRRCTYIVDTTRSAQPGRHAHVQQAEADFDPDRSTQRQARVGRVAASLRRAGRKTNARAYDAMIAATALANDLPIYTCNPDDFAGIDGLEVVPVPLPAK